MVLLKGLNYDVSNQQSTVLSTYIADAETTINVESTTGFPSTGFIVIAPDTPQAEIVAFSAITTFSMIVGALVFPHNSGDKVFIAPYNNMKFYSSSTETGTYVVVAASTKIMTYDQNYTNFDYVGGNSSLYYKRTFYNSVTLTESDISVSDYWQVTEDEYLATAAELRAYLQFDANDYPNDADMQTLISIASKEVTLDLATTSKQIIFFAQLLLARYYVLRGLASRALAKGYIQVNAEGRQIVKAYNELAKEAQNAKEEYGEFLKNNGRTEVTKTDFLNDLPDVETRQDIIDVQTGFQNGLDYGRNYKYSYGTRSRRS